MRYHYKPVRMARKIFLYLTILPSADELVEQQELSYIASDTATLENSLAVSYKVKHTPTI